MNAGVSVEGHENDILRVLMEIEARKGPNSSITLKKRGVKNSLRKDRELGKLFSSVNYNGTCREGS